VSEGPQKALRDRLSGSWRLVSFTLKHPAGRETHPYGKDAIGMLSYDGHGHMAGQIMSRRRPAFASERPRGGTDDEVRAAFDGYIAYFGTYSVDEAASVVTHQVEGSLLPNWIGTPQRRNVAFRDGRLVLSAAIEAGIVVEIVWERR
jgi:Lipocalin-like domain